MELFIDRIEGDIAVLIGREDGKVRLTIPVSALPPGCTEGGILTMALAPDRDATERARNRVRAIQERLRSDR